MRLFVLAFILASFSHYAGASIVRWNAEGSIFWFGDPAELGVFSHGDPVTISIDIDLDTAPTSTDAISATYEPQSFILQIGTHTFGSADGTSDLRVLTQTQFHFLIHIDPDLPTPGHWIEQIGFASSIGGSERDTSIPTELPALGITAFDVDLHSPIGYHNLHIGNRVVSVTTIVPVPGVPIPLLLVLITGLARFRRIGSQRARPDFSTHCQPTRSESRNP